MVGRRSGLAGILLTAGAMTTSGCFHTEIETGLAPGAVGYSEEWEDAWLIGAVPAHVDATRACEGPWATVRTRQSLLNGIVTVLTLGIYSPHEVEVTCARDSSGAGAAAVGTGPKPEDTGSTGRVP